MVDPNDLTFYFDELFVQNLGRTFSHPLSLTPLYKYPFSTLFRELFRKFSTTLDKGFQEFFIQNFHSLNLNFLLLQE